MTAETEVRISYNEVTRVSLVCTCGVEITFDLNKEDHKRKDWSHTSLECPFCKKKFDSALGTALGGFTSWLDGIERSKEIVCFRIRRP